MTQSDQSNSVETWRDEMYGDEGGQDPFWVPLEASDGHHRNAFEAADLVKGFVGGESFEDGLKVELISGRMEDMGPDGYFFHKDPEGDVAVWEVSCG